MAVKYFAILDTETNSFVEPGNSDSGLPIQISAVITNIDFVVIKSINVFIKQDYLDPRSVAVHGFTREKLEELNALSMHEAYEKFYIESGVDWENTAAIAHNSSFDQRIMERFAQKCGRYDKIPQYLDTLKYFKTIRDPEKKNNKLETVVNYLGGNKDTIGQLTQKIYRTNNQYHDARYDTAALLFATYKVRDKFLNYYSSKL